MPRHGAFGQLQKRTGLRQKWPLEQLAPEKTKHCISWYNWPPKFGQIERLDLDHLANFKTEHVNSERTGLLQNCSLE